MSVIFEIFLREANAEGFSSSGGVDAEAFFKSKLYRKSIEHYSRAVKDDRIAAMEYLARGEAPRRDIEKVMPGTKALLCAALPYGHWPHAMPSPNEGPRYSRYVQGGDYHREVTLKLENIMRKITAEHNELKYRICVDTAPVLEKIVAAACGIGWIGKNTLLMNERSGSFMFLGVVLIDATIGADVEVMDDSACDGCSRCVDACPTRALCAPMKLDARRCISYQTLENKSGPDLSIGRANYGNWVAGCDVCQDACPVNEPLRRPPHRSLRWSMNWNEHIEETEAQFRSRVQGTPLECMSHERFLKNIVIMGGSD
ncbi:MAG: tRNA epoxyqueuosine(34) reductase QueG [Bdellovibrionales bacterium RIFOXYD1_FULL_53_11]|nr:MAG: tRNA epoxyqueuosine(34) reductase QueG [Bdellovibrionales bacterium RIFOXYD1_FULL_53_11]